MLIYLSKLVVSYAIGHFVIESKDVLLDENEPENGNKKQRLSSMTYDQIVSNLGVSKPEVQGLLQKSKQKDSKTRNYELEIPEEFICPITQDVMKHPVLCSDGFIYEKAAIGKSFLYFQVANLCIILQGRQTCLKLDAQLIAEAQKQHFLYPWVK